MKKLMYFIFISGCCLLSGIHYISAQNPLILDQFTADPSARVFENKIYVYPSHDIPCQKKQGIMGFCMADYHVFSSENLSDWEDHGIIISQEDVEWVDSTSFSLWAPDCIDKEGKYYFYFPAIPRDKSVIRGPRIGIAISETPYGPFKPESEPIDGIVGIDPNVFIDKDRQAYIYWASMRRLFMAKLKDNMKELASAPQEIEGLPEKFKEGPFLFTRNGIYYLTFPYVADRTEQLVYATGDNPVGPFKYTGVIMDELPTGCWTNHHSIIKYRGQWYLFYHNNDLSPDFDKNRSIRVDSLFFNEDGTIQKVIPTLRGVGITDATKKIQIDRYSAISEKGASVEFLDKDNKQEGWKTILKKKNAWVLYKRVDFGNENLKSVKVNALSKKGGIIDIRLDNIEGPAVAQVETGKNKEWNVITSPLSDIPCGIHHIYVILSGSKKVEIDWISFE